MSRIGVGTAETGRPCPACRFPLRHGTVAERCDACGALHHEECWREAGGCAVEGCAGGDTAVMPATAPSPPPAAPLPPAVAPPPPPAVPLPPAVAPASNRGVALGLLVGLALAGAALAGYLVARGGDEATPIARTTVVSTDEGPPAAAPPAKTAPASEDPQRQAMEEIAQIVRLSLLGRTAVREGRYAEAIANRELVLQRLDDLPGARGAVARAQAMLRAAMEASLASDRAYAEGRSAAASDRAATAYKRDFVAQWNPLAARYGLEPYTEGEI